MKTEQNTSDNRQTNWKKYALRKAVFLLLIGIVVAFMVRNSKKQNTTDDPVYDQLVLFRSMSTLVSVQLYHPVESELRSGIDAVQGSMKAVEQLCSIYDPESELSRLNASAHKEPFVCSEDLWEILIESRKYYEISGGAFDITVNPLTKLWKRHKNEGTLPAQDELDAALDLVGLDKVEFNDEERSVQFTREGMSLDLGGIAKGWALDRAQIALALAGFESGYIDLGGNVLCLKVPPPKKDAYRVGIRDPFNHEKYFAVTELLKEAVATSGSYERYIEIEGKKYSHILNPKTGMPVDGDILSVSVVAPKGVETDALSTSIFINGQEFAEKLVKENPAIRILILFRGSENPDKTLVQKIGKGWEINYLPERADESLPAELPSPLN